MRLDILKCSDVIDIKRKIAETLSVYYKTFLPDSKEALILIKPNLNNNFNGLTGNTTDLRIIAAVVEFLLSLGYKNIIIGDGPNSGFFKRKIDIISQLKIDKLAEYYGVKAIDLNYSTPKNIKLDNKETFQIAKEVLESELIINLPKFKMHFEVGITGALKNLIGCLLGEENKKKIHNNLMKNILRLNQIIKPKIHILDGLIALEGTGPTRGIPVNLGLILISTDPYLVDLAIAFLSRYPVEEVPLLAEAKKEGILKKDHYNYLYALNLEKYSRSLKKPNPSFFAKLVHNPKRQKYFLKIRRTKLFDYLCSTECIGKILYVTGLRQDKFNNQPMKIIKLFWKENNDCIPAECRKCSAYCPINLDLPNAFLEDLAKQCINCLYCYQVCPKPGTINFEGELGFFEEQQKQFGNLVREIA